MGLGNSTGKACFRLRDMNASACSLLSVRVPVAMQEPVFALRSFALRSAQRAHPLLLIGAPYRLMAGGDVCRRRKQGSPEPGANSG